eukprot:2549213-Rhodomonas_salina.2
MSGEREELKTAIRNLQWERERTATILRDAQLGKVASCLALFAFASQRSVLTSVQAAAAENNAVLQREAQVAYPPYKNTSSHPMRWLYAVRQRRCVYRDKSAVRCPVLT